MALGVLRKQAVSWTILIKFYYAIWRRQGQMSQRTSGKIVWEHKLSVPIVTYQMDIYKELHYLQ